MIREEVNEKDLEKVKADMAISAIEAMGDDADEDDVQLVKELKGKWAIQGVWNRGLTFGREERELKPRTHIWASEIGKDPYMRYLSMTAVKPDFDFNVRVLRKFAVGDLLERLMGAVLIIAGILKHDNERYEIPEDDEHLMVSVKPDFIAGGKIDWERSKTQMDNNMLFEFMPSMKGIAEGMMEFLQVKHPDGLKDLLYEIKSVNSMLFWAKKDYLTQAYPHHVMQTYTGMKATGIKEGRILYISKDDYTVAEIPIHLENPELEKLWDDDVRRMTKFIREGVPPPKPQSLIYDTRKKIRFQHKKVKHVINGAYTSNWQIEWSNYLPTITGFKSADEWKASLKDELKAKNDDIKEKFKIIKGLTK